MEGLIPVRLRDSGQAQTYNAGNLSVKEGDYVIVEHDRGLDYGQIVSPAETAKEAGSPAPGWSDMREPWSTSAGGCPTGGA